jgi:hypothetical protein
LVDFGGLMEEHENWVEENKDEWDPAEELEKVEVPKND